MVGVDEREEQMDCYADEKYFGDVVIWQTISNYLHGRRAVRCFSWGSRSWCGLSVPLIPEGEHEMYHPPRLVGRASSRWYVRGRMPTLAHGERFPFCLSTARQPSSHARNATQSSHSHSHSPPSVAAVRLLTANHA